MFTRRKRQMIESMNMNTKLEVALEILSSKIAETSKKGLSIEDKEMKNLIQEREKLYSGNEEVLDKIIDIYGKEIKRKYDEVKK